MLTPAGTKDSSKRASRLGSSTFSNPFKRRGSNAAVFTTPSGSNFAFQQLEDIGFAEPQHVVDAPFAVNPPSFAWPPRKPLPRSSITSNIPSPDSRLADSPTVRRPRLNSTHMSTTTLASRIPTPGIRNGNRTSPLKLRPTLLQTPQNNHDQIREREPSKPPSSYQENVRSDQMEGIEDYVARPSRTTSTRAQLNRLSSYEIVHHQLLKPRSPRLNSSSNLFAISSLTNSESDFKQTTCSERSIPLKLTSSRCVSGSPPKRMKLETSQSHKQASPLHRHRHSPPPILPPIMSSPNFDPTMTIGQTPDPLDVEEASQKGVEARKTVSTDKLVEDSVDGTIEHFFETSQPKGHFLSRQVPVDKKPEVEEGEDVPVNHVFEACSTAYWTGRFMSLNDRLMDDAHALPDPRDADGEDKMHQLEVARTKQIFSTLQECCQTASAEASLKQFKRMYALKKHMPLLLQAVPKSGIATLLRRNNKHEEKSNDWASLSSASTVSVGLECGALDDPADKPKLPRMNSNDSAVSSGEGKRSRFVDKLRRMAS